MKKILDFIGVNRVFSVISDLLNTNSPRSSRRAILLVITGDFCGLSWYIATHKNVISNAELLKEVVQSHVWIMGIGLGAIVTSAVAEKLSPKKAAETQKEQE